MVKWSHLWEPLHKKLAAIWICFWKLVTSFPLCLLNLCNLEPFLSQFSVYSCDKWINSVAFHCSRQGIWSGYPCCSFSTYRTECTTGEAEAFGVVVLGFPYNHFEKQEQGENSEVLFWAEVSVCLGPCRVPVRISLPYSTQRPLHSGNFWGKQQISGFNIILRL